MQVNIEECVAMACTAIAMDKKKHTQSQLDDHIIRESKSFHFVSTCNWDFPDFKGITSALSKQVTKITAQQYETIITCWNRPSLTVDTLTGGTQAYLCPLPASMCNAYKAPINMKTHNQASTIKILKDNLTI